MHIALCQLVCYLYYTKGQQTFSVNGQRETILVFAGQEAKLRILLLQPEKKQIFTNFY